MIADPPVREDGRCAQCHGPRRNFAKLRRHRAEAEADPFCSAVCARQWHDQPDVESRPRRQEVSSQARQRPGGFDHGTVAGYRLCACELCKQATQDAKTRVA